MRHNPNSTVEIEESMAQLLTPAYIEKKASSNGTAEAMVSLVKAAEIFENLNMFVPAEAVTNILESIAGIEDDMKRKEEAMQRKEEAMQRKEEAMREMRESLPVTMTPKTFKTRDDIMTPAKLQAFMESNDILSMRIGQMVFYYDLDEDQLKTVPSRWGKHLPDMSEEYLVWNSKNE